MAKRSGTHVPSPFWRDNRIIPILLQLIFVIVVAVTGWYLINNAVTGLNALGIKLGFGFLDSTASFNIGESMIEFDSTNTYLRAIFVGVLNTIKVSFIGIIFATIIGFIVGVSRLSSNWLIQRLSSLYIEIFRNTPLLVQIFIWYFAVFLQLPQVKESVQVGAVYLNNRGTSIPWFVANGATTIWLILIVIGSVVSIVVWKTKLNAQIKTGKRKFPAIWAIASFLLSLVIAFALTLDGPFNMTYPEMGKFSFEGGYTITPEFSAIFIGLTIYTATYIAEIVRGGVLSVSKGQVEASKALGLKGSTTMRLVIFPQAIRIIIPPLTSQYLNLTKNSSLAIAVGYPDLVYVGKVINNQTGHAIESVAIMIIVYLTLSILTSILMNIFNKKAQIVER